MKEHEYDCANTETCENCRNGISKKEMNQCVYCKMKVGYCCTDKYHNVLQCGGYNCASLQMRLCRTCFVRFNSLLHKS